MTNINTLFVNTASFDCHTHIGSLLKLNLDYTAIIKNIMTKKGISTTPVPKPVPNPVPKPTSVHNSGWTTTDSLIVASTAVDSGSVDSGSFDSGSFDCGIQ